MQESAESYRARLRERLSLEGRIDDSEVIKLLREIVDSPNPDPTLYVFAGSALLAYGDKRFLPSVLKMLANCPKIAWEKPARYFLGAIRSLIPIPTDLSISETPASVLAWYMANEPSIQWDDSRELFVLKS